MARPGPVPIRSDGPVRPRPIPGEAVAGRRTTGSGLHGLLVCLAACLAAWAVPSAPLSGQAVAPAPRDEAAGQRIVVSLDARELWLVEGADTVFRAPVAVGRDEVFRFAGTTVVWSTPRGERRVLAKRSDPVWTVPEWHYYERASEQGLRVVRMRRGGDYPLPDGSSLMVRGANVVRVLGDRFWKVPQGSEIIIDGKLYVPPAGTVQRRIPGALGTRALDLGDGYLIHGTTTYNRSSIGAEASHGCIRMGTADIERLFDLVAEGTPVLIK